jgi:L-tartrate/succinate antiporter
MKTPQGAPASTDEAHRSRGKMPLRLSWKALLPIAIAIVIALIPAPTGLAPHAWYFFAIFTAVIVGLMLEPIPGPAISLLGVTLVTVLAPWVLYGPADLSKPGFNPANAALSWALSGFANNTVWLIFGAFMFALGYDKTGLGRRIALVLVRAMGRKTLTLGYAVTLADTLLAPFTPSTTARSAGTIYPVIDNLPPLYGSMPNDPSARRIGSYLMWTALAATCITSSAFLTGSAPNLLAVEIVKKTLALDISWTDWLIGFAPAGVLLLLALPLLVYVLFPPSIKEGSEVPAWAGQELHRLGPLSRREIILAVLVLLALTMWILGTDYVNATTAALIVVCLMLVTNIVRWDDMLGNKQAWSTLVWFGTLIPLADGLNRTGFVGWFAQSVAEQMTGFSPTVATIVLVSVYFFSHYMFASITAHVTAMLPVMLAVGGAIPEMPVQQFAMMLILCNGIMFVLTPYAGGPNPIYYGSGYLPAKYFWPLGAIFGLIFFATWLSIGMITL